VIAQAKGFIFDSDGTLQDKGVPIEGARDLIQLLNDKKIPYVIGTNSSVKRSHKRQEELRSIHIDVADGTVLTSGDAITFHLKSLQHAVRAYVLGGSSVQEVVSESGAEIVDLSAWDKGGWREGKEPNAVIVGRLDQIDMQNDIDPAANAILRNGASFIATNDDRYTVGPTGVVHSGTGFLVRGLEYATGKRPHIVGKPYPPMVQMALQRLGMESHQTVIVGDNVETDMGCALEWQKAFQQKLGACLIGTGVAIGNFGADDHIDAVCSSVADLVGFLRQVHS
jgi:4-nitrophenyl phosphatase